MHTVRRFSIFGLMALLAGQALLSVLMVPASALAAMPTTHLVISELQTSVSSRPADEFIELYNPTNNPISLAGMSLQLKDATVSYPTLRILNLPSDAVISAYGFYLVTNDTPTIGYSGTVAPDATFAVPDLPEAGGTIFLVSDTGLVMNDTDATIVDRVGYGTGDAAETAPAPAPATDKSIERLPDHDYTDGNGVDTDNNAADFLVRDLPNPQNSHSPVEQGMAPVIDSLTPASGSLSASSTVTISAHLSDAGSGINSASIGMWLDDQSVSSVNYDSSTGIASSTITVPDGQHTVKLQVSDNAGFLREQVWYFQTDSQAPTLTITNSVSRTDRLTVSVRLMAEDGSQYTSSGVTQMQVAFDGVLDNEAWVPFSETVTGTMPYFEGKHMIVARVRDKAGNISNIASTSVTVQSIAPAGPTHAISSTNGNTVTLSWDPVPGAVAYWVRYSDGQVLYGPIQTANTQLVISGLDMSKTYHFEVASLNGVGAVSNFTKVFPPEVVAANGSSNVTEVSSATETVIESTETAPEVSTTSRRSVAPSPSPSPTLSPTPSPSPAIKSGDDDQPRDWTRVIVALSILIIAAGVATGGWYLYQWWTTRPTGNGKGKGGRW